MSESLNDYLQSHRDEAYLLLRRYVSSGKHFLLRTDLLDELDAFAAENHAACSFTRDSCQFRSAPTPSAKTVKSKGIASWWSARRPSNA